MACLGWVDFGKFPSFRLGLMGFDEIRTHTKNQLPNFKIHLRILIQRFGIEMYRNIWIILDVTNCEGFPKFLIRIAVIFRFSMFENMGNYVKT